MSLLQSLSETRLKGFSFGELFHTALRKGSDTDWSVLLWNLINSTNAPEDGWGYFCEDATVRYNAGESILTIMSNGMWANGKNLSPLGRALNQALSLCDVKTAAEVDGFFTYCLKEGVTDQ